MVHMRIAIIVAGLVSWGMASTVHGGETRPTVTFLQKRGYVFPPPGAAPTTAPPQEKWPEVVYYNTEYKSPLLGSLSIPYSFAKIERNGGKFQVSPVISLGLAYNFFFGDFIFGENDRILTDQSFCFGPMALAGVQNDFNLNKFTSIVTGGFIGLGPISLFFGYDYFTNSFSLEFGQRVDFYLLSQNFLNPIGRVHPVRNPKSTAIPVKYE
jgi:hypothetical protein